MIPPSSHVIDAIKENEVRIAALDTEIEELYELIAQRKAARLELIATIEHQKSTIAPIGHLPFEILGIIFLHFLHDQHHGPTSQSGSDFSTPPSVLTLVQTCRQWKTVAYGTPGVWSQFSIVLGSNGGKWSPRVMEPIFERAGAYPLVFGMAVYPSWTWSLGNAEETQDFYENEVDHFLELLNRLNPTFKSVHIQGLGAFSASTPHRWRSFLSFVEYLATHPQATRSMTSFRLLPTTLFVSGRPFTDPEIQIVGSAFTTFKALTTLQIPAGVLQHSSPVLKHIKDLQITNNSPAFGPGFTEIIPTIQACSILETLTISRSRFSNEESIVKVTLPELRQLVVDQCDEVDAIFARLRVPMLQDLTLAQNGSYRRRETVYRLVFKTLLEQETGTPRLTKLHILSYNIPVKTLIWILERLPTLMELTIHDHKYLDTVFMEALCKPPTARKGWLCPNLQRLELRNCYKIDRVQLTQIIDARVAGSFQHAGASAGKGKCKEQKQVAPLKSVMFNGTELVGSEQEPVALMYGFLEDGPDRETGYIHDYQGTPVSGVPFFGASQSQYTINHVSNPLLPS